MKTINIRMPLAGFVDIEVEVEDDFDETEDNIEQLFWDNPPHSLEEAAHCEWGYLPKVARGDVLFAPESEMSWFTEK